MARRGLLQAGAHRLRRWLPMLTVLWALTATAAVLQPCREALAASLPHPHGPQVASAAHAHSHGPEAGPHHPANGADCQCTELAPPFIATALDLDPLAGLEGATASFPPAAGAGTSASQATGVRVPAIPRPERPRYLTTSRLRI